MFVQEFPEFMKITITGFGEGHTVSASIPMSKIIKAFWKESIEPAVLTVSTGKNDEEACANFTLDEESSSHQSITITTEKELPLSRRICSWFRLELSDDSHKDTRGFMYGGNGATETSAPIVMISDGSRHEDDTSRRIVWVNKSLACPETWTNTSENLVKAITEEQLNELLNSQKFDFSSYGKRLEESPNNNIYFINDTIVSKSKKEIEMVADNLHAMGIFATVGRYRKSKGADSKNDLAGFYYIAI